MKPETKSIPSQPVAQPAKCVEPTLFEVVQIAAVLATSAENQGKPPIKVTQKALDFWQAARDLRQAEDDKRFLMATVAKSWSPDRSEQITHEKWVDRLFKYPGDKLGLFVDFIYAKEVPVEELLKEMFPAPKVSRRELMKELLAFAGSGCGKHFLWLIARFLTSDCDEADQQLLLNAIETGDLKQAGKWFESLGSDEFLVQMPFLELIVTAKQGFEFCFTENTKNNTKKTVPALLCRPLIGFREMQISGIRAKAARKTAATSFPDQKSTRQPKTNKKKPRR